MSKCRVFVVVDTEGKACAIYDNKLSAWDYVNARDPECREKNGTRCTSAHGIAWLITQ